MVDRFYGLRHYSVIGGYHQNRYVGYLCPPGPQCREGFMARSVDKSYCLTLEFHDRGSYMLGDASHLLVGYACISYGIEERGLAMIDMAHNRYNRRSRLERFRPILGHYNLLAGPGLELEIDSQFIGNQQQSIAGD